MARRPSQSRPERPFHTIEQKRQCIAQLERRIAELEAFDLQTVVSRFSDPNVTALQAAIGRTLSAVFGYGTHEYNHFCRAARLDNGPVTARMPDWIAVRGGGGNHNDRHGAVRYLSEGKGRSLAHLREAVRALNEEIEFTSPQIAKASAMTGAQVIFLRQAMSVARRFLARPLPVSRGRTLWSGKI